MFLASSTLRNMEFSFSIVTRSYSCSRIKLAIPRFSRPRTSLFPACRHFSVSEQFRQEPTELEEHDKHHSSKLKDKLAERDLFLSVLSATTTKREAKSYLSRFTPPDAADKSTPQDQAEVSNRTLRIALIKLRSPQDLEDDVLGGVAHTFSQLARLGLSCVIVVDCTGDGGSRAKPTWREEVVTEADRLVSALQTEASIKARRLDYALGVNPAKKSTPSVVSAYGGVEVQYPEALLEPIRNGTIIVVPPIGYTTRTQRVIRLDPDDVVLALTRQFAGLGSGGAVSARCETGAQSGATPISQSDLGVTLDRIILLDPLGGLPSATRPDNSHVFINFEQEYEDVRRELIEYHATEQLSSSVDKRQIRSPKPLRRISIGDSIPQIHKTVMKGYDHLGEPISNTVRVTRNRHVQNLDLLQRTLALLPPLSSAILTTPYEASTRSTDEKPFTTDLGVITRRPKNPLIHNLLTDKPLVSSSLPVSRLGSSMDRQSARGEQPNPATFFKRGMPLTMIPNPQTHVWEPPDPSKPQLSLRDSRIDLPRLLNLIEDSFGRPLDVEDYLNRIQNKIAGVIVAGEYEGGAILTWELPPGVPDDGSEASRQRMVPYLDKFAVLKRSQGAGGVADIVFTSMVRSCFPNGVCWRSRKDNPVNKWYFERSVGTWKIADTNWTMFWTTNGLFDQEQTFFDYAGVCRAVQPSWADNKVAD